MAFAVNKAEKQLREITECSICMNAFNDPRMLSCIHTFCLECLERTGEVQQKRPGDKMSCPLCRKEFTIPSQGFIGLQRNFFMENFLEFKQTLQDHPSTSIIGTEIEKDIKRIAFVKTCTKEKHTEKPLDYYCADCKKIVCVSCFVESHKLHDCKDVATVEEDMRYKIKRVVWKTTHYADEMISLRNKAEMMKTDFLKKIEDIEASVIKRNQELKELIDKHTKSVLEELLVIKSDHCKEIESQLEKIEGCSTILRSFETYCSELELKGSASDICSSFDQLIARADELERDHEEFIGRPYQSVEIAFQATNLEEILQNTNNNLVGNVEAKTETKTKLEDFAFVVTRTTGFMKINLHRPNEISTQGKFPTKIDFLTVAAVYCNTMYITGIGGNCDEIWKYITTSGWVKCASLVKRRCGHSTGFIDEVLYICGGIVDSVERGGGYSGRRVLDIVETYNAITNKCTVVGKLIHRVYDSRNCVPFKSSLYIFGGADKDGKEINHVQVYHTKSNTCSVLSKPMPQPSRFMRAVLWDSSVFLRGGDNFFIFNFETETWKERKWLKTSSYDNFGLVLDNGRVFIIDGYDARYVPLRNILDDKPIAWKIHATFPKAFTLLDCVTVDDCVNMRLSVNFLNFL